MLSVQEKFARVALDIYAMESMTYMTAAIMDHYEEPDVSVESAIVKVRWDHPRIRFCYSPG